MIIGMHGVACEVLSIMHRAGARLAVALMRSARGMHIQRPPALRPGLSNICQSTAESVAPRFVMSPNDPRRSYVRGLRSELHDV